MELIAETLQHHWATSFCTNYTIKMASKFSYQSNALGCNL